MIFLVFVSILCFLLGIIFVEFSLCTENSLSIIPAVLCFMFFGITLKACEDYTEPQAIDVYRSKTTLRITYEDGIPIDSIVIFKK